MLDGQMGIWDAEFVILSNIDCRCRQLDGNIEIARLLGVASAE